MESPVINLASAIKSPGVIRVYQDGDDLVVSVRNGTFHADIPSVWEGHKVKVYYVSSSDHAPIVKAIAYILMAILLGTIVVGIVSVIVVSLALHH